MDIDALESLSTTLLLRERASSGPFESCKGLEFAKRQVPPYVYSGSVTSRGPDGEMNDHVSGEVRELNRASVPQRIMQ